MVSHTPARSKKEAIAMLDKCVETLTEVLANKETVLRKEREMKRNLIAAQQAGSQQAEVPPC